jgi:hypothetical protein
MPVHDIIDNREFEIPAAEIARHLGVTTASITRAVQKTGRKAS